MKEDIAKLLVFAAIGIGIGVFGITKLMKGQATQGWSETQGTVTQSKIIKKTTTSRGSGKSRTRRRVDLLDIEYRYTVDGKEYVSSKFGVCGPSEGVRQVVRKYPEGTQVTVYYDPKDPTNAVLQQGVGQGPYAIMGVGFGFSVLVLLVFLCKLLMKKSA